MEDSSSSGAGNTGGTRAADVSAATVRTETAAGGRAARRWVESVRVGRATAGVVVGVLASLTTAWRETAAGVTIGVPEAIRAGAPGLVRWLAVQPKATAATMLAAHAAR